MESRHRKARSSIENSAATGRYYVTTGQLRDAAGVSGAIARWAAQCLYSPRRMDLIDHSPGPRLHRAIPRRRSCTCWDRSATKLANGRTNSPVGDLNVGLSFLFSAYTLTASAFYLSDASSKIPIRPCVVPGPVHPGTGLACR